MKLIHKLLVLSAGLLIPAINVTAQGKWTLPTYYVNASTNLNGGTNAIAAASAAIYTLNSASNNIALTRFDGTYIQMSAALMGAGTSAITAMFDASNDGTNWVSPYTFVTMTAAGTTAVSSGTNLVNQHVGYLRLNYVTNASNAVLTNLLVTYSRKPIRAGN
jgi:hypothetical protein